MVRHSTPPSSIQSFFTLSEQYGRVAKLLLILLALGAVVDGLASPPAEPPLLID